MTDPIDPGPRRPFERAAPPEPFYQTPEFRRSAALLGLLLVAGVILLFVLMEQTSQVEEAEQAQESRQAAEALMAGQPLTAEEREERKRALYAKLEGALSDTENGQPLVQQTAGYWKLLEIMLRWTPEEVSARTKYNFEWDLVMKDPDAWRGEFVDARGVIRRVAAVKLERPVMGRTDLYRVMMTDQENFWFVDLPERPTGVQEGDAVDTQGVFYRTVSYESATGETQVAPLIAARDMRPIPPRVETGWRLFIKEHTLAIFGVMALIVFGGSLLFSVMRQGKRRNRTAAATTGSFGELFDQKLREEGKIPPPRE